MTNVDISRSSSGTQPRGAGLPGEPAHPFAADDRVEVKSIADLVGRVRGERLRPPPAVRRPDQASSISLRFARFVDTLRAYMRVTIGSASLPKNPPIVGTS